MTLTTYSEFGLPSASAHFMWRRLIRVVPLYWIATLAYTAKLVWSGTPPEPLDLLRSFLFIPYLARPFDYTPVYGLGWTLNYEMLFYLMFAAALLMRRWVGLIGLLLALNLLVATHDYGWGSNCTVGDPLCDIITVYQSPIILYFGGGIMLALLRRAWQERAPLPSVRTEYAVGAATLLIAAYALATLTLLEPGTTANLWQLIVCICVTSICTISHDVERPGKLRQLILTLGDASYSIYLTHSFVVGPASRIWETYLGNSLPVVFTCLMLVASSVLGVFVFHYFEMPTLKLIRRHFPVGDVRKRPVVAS